MKQELKYIVPYLPYSVPLMNQYGNWHNTTSHKDISIYDMLNMKLVLIPLSDLKQGNEVLEAISKKAYGKMTDIEFDSACYKIHQDKGYDYIPHWMFQDLIKNHVDIFKLIEKGLAVDINTL